MATPAFNAAAQNVYPKLALDFTTATLDARVSLTRSLNTATRVNASGNIKIVNADTPRFDYNPLTLACKGLLIEESRTNIFQYSEDFSNAWWLKTGMLAFGSGSVANAINSPDGTQNADLLTEDTSAGNHVISSNLTTNFVSGTSYCQSYFVKANGRSKCTVSFRSNWFGTNGANFDLVAKTATKIANASASTVCGIEEYKDSWFRIWVAATATATGTSAADTYLYFVDGTGAISYTGDGTSGMYVWGAQLETGLFPTSYIPNLSNSTTTRNADIAIMTGTDFSDWYNAAKGTFRVDATSPASGTRPIISADDDTANNSLLIKTEGSAPTFVVTQGGSEQANVAAGTITANADMYAYVSYDADYFGVARVTSRQVDTTGTVPTVDRLRIGASQTGAYLNGIVKKVQFWN